MLSEKDLKQIEENSLTVNQIVKQIETFVRGIPFVNIVTTASVKNGIQVLSKEEIQKYEAYFEAHKDEKELVKFVPASGAATRMFKFLHEFLDEFDPEKEQYRDFIKKGEYNQVKTFFSRTADFAFVNLVRNKIRNLYPEYKKSSKGMRFYLFAKTLLDEKGLNYANLPKGLIPFHKYKKYAITAFEEQLFEAAHYCAVGEDVHLHFTFSEKDLGSFKQEFENIKSRVSRKTKKKFHITYSFQKKETNTLAVTFDNNPFRDDNGKLVFRLLSTGHCFEP
ncbi:MAG: DUF4301 family protein [Flavobacteriaceae bacterium]